MNQKETYKLQQEERIKDVTYCLEEIIRADGEEFKIVRQDDILAIVE